MCCSAAGEGAAGPGAERATAVARAMEQREAAALQRLQQQQQQQPEIAVLRAASLASSEAAAAGSAGPAGASAAQARPAAEVRPGKASAALDRGGFGSMELHETHVLPSGHGARPPLAGRGTGQQGAVSTGAGAGAGAGAATISEGQARQAAGAGAPQQAAGGGLSASAGSEERRRLAQSLNRETSLRTFMRSHSPITGAHSPRWMSDAKQQQQWDAAADAATAAHRGSGSGSSVQGAEPAAGAAEPDAAATVGGGGALATQGGRQEGSRGLSAVHPAAGLAPVGRSIAVAAAAVGGGSRGQGLQRGQASRQDALKAEPEVLSMHGPPGSGLMQSASGEADPMQQPASQRAAGGAAHVQQPAASRPATQQQAPVEAKADPVSLRAAPPFVQEQLPAAARAVPMSPRAARQRSGTFADTSVAPPGSAGSNGHAGEALASPQGSGRLASPFSKAARLPAGAKPASHSRRGSGNLSPLRSPSSPQQALSGNMSPQRGALQDGPTKEDIARSRLQVRQTGSISHGCKGFGGRHAWAYSTWQQLQDAGCEVSEISPGLNL